MSVQCTWLGQASLLLDFNGVTVMVDPYLSDSIGKMKPDKHRAFIVPDRYRDFHPDALILTHDHLDHVDPESLERILNTDKQICVMAGAQAWTHARSFGGPHNYVECKPGTEWTEKGLRFSFIYADHSDHTAVGAVISGEKTIYISGDTLYHKRILSECPQGVDVAFLPINGVGNNMNAVDAARLAADLHAKTAVPLHYGLLDHLTADGFDYPGKKVLKELVTVEL